MRHVIAISLLAAIVFFGCVSYPTLEDDTTTGDTSTGGTSGSGSGGSSTGGSGGGSAGPGDDTGDPNDPNDPNAPAEPSATVGQRVCSRVITVNWTEPERVVVYYATGSNFNTWDPGDEVEFDDAEGELVNLENDLRVQSQVLGEPDAETFLRDATQITLSVVLQDGTLWLVSANDYVREVTQWVTNGDHITVVRNDDGDFHLVNLRRCTSIAATAEQ